VASGSVVDFCENRPAYHYWAPDVEEVAKAIDSILECKRKELKKYAP